MTSPWTGDIIPIVKCPGNKIVRRKTRPVWIGRVKVGGQSPISVQSMTKTATEDIKATVRQIRELEELGCQIIRLGLPHQSAVRAIPAIKRQIHIPIEADIHFNPQLALESIARGVDAIRLNPGNITDKDAIREIVKQANRKEIPIRVGVNSGSVKGWREKRRKIRDEMRKKETWRTMVDSAMDYCRYLESLKFRDIMVSLKAPDVATTINAYRAIARKTDYPLHLGVTAAGPLTQATIKSALGIGALLLEGIGDTIRVSITGPPHDEVSIGYEILRSVGLAKRGPEIISCPTCARCEIDVVKITEKVRKKLAVISSSNTQLKIAIMGCVVNGPGEASEADIGVAGGNRFGFLFKHGRKIRKVAEPRIVTELIKEIRRLC